MIFSKTNSKEHSIIIDSFLGELNKYTENNTVHVYDGTIKNFTGVKKACKLELSIIGNKAILEHLTGDVEGVIGWREDELIGCDLLVLMHIDKNLVNKAFEELEKNNFFYKENTFVGSDGRERHTQSILMWRIKGKKLVEIIWQK
jgi:hypothetical protein